jgi:hypothetical protein
MKDFFTEERIQNMEKFSLIIIVSTIVFSILYMWMFRDKESYMINELAYVFGGYLVCRKGLSYWKPDRYGGQNQQYSNYQPQQYNSQPLSPIQNEQDFQVEPSQQVQLEQTISPKSSY